MLNKFVLLIFLCVLLAVILSFSAFLSFCFLFSLIPCVFSSFHMLCFSKLYNLFCLFRVFMCLFLKLYMLKLFRFCLLFDIVFIEAYSCL